MLVPPAQALCGAYLGGVEATPENRASRPAIARQGEQTTFTRIGDVDGHTGSFGKLEPIRGIIRVYGVGRTDRNLLDEATSRSNARYGA